MDRRDYHGRSFGKGLGPFFQLGLHQCSRPAHFTFMAGCEGGDGHGIVADDVLVLFRLSGDDAEMFYLTPEQVGEQGTIEEEGRELGHMVALSQNIQLDQQPGEDRSKPREQEADARRAEGFDSKECSAGKQPEYGRGHRFRFRVSGCMFRHYSSNSGGFHCIFTFMGESHE